jgi:hypothetical protein
MNRLEKAPKSSERLSYVYRTEFIDGSIHFGRVNASKHYSPKGYISNAVSAVKHNSKNPLRACMTTEFEYKVVEEFDTLKCEIVFVGSSDEARTYRDKMVKETSVFCMNRRKSGDDSLGIDNIVRVAKEFTKVLKSATETFYFIEPKYGRSIGLAEKIISNVKHPIYSDYLKLACIQVERF